MQPERYTVQALPPILVPLLGISSRELLSTSLALVYRWVLRMCALVMTVMIILAGKCNAAFITLKTNGWRSHVGGDCYPWVGLEWGRVSDVELIHHVRQTRGLGDQTTSCFVGTAEIAPWRPLV